MENSFYKKGEEGGTQYPKISREDRESLRRYRRKHEEAKKRQQRKTILAVVSFAIIIAIVFALVTFGGPKIAGGKSMDVPTLKR